MKKIIRLTESDLIRVIKRVINENMEMDYTPSYDIQSVDCGDNVRSGHVDLDGETIVIRYCEGNEEDLEYLKEKGERLLYSNNSLSDDYSENIYESFDDMESTNELDEIVNDLVNNATFNDGREVFVGYGIDKTILGSWGRQSATRSGMRVFDKFFDGYCMSNYGITDMSDLNYIKNEFVTKMDMKINKIVHPYFY